MGTRGAFGFRIDTEDKVTYNHWDSYPEGLGRQIFKFITNHTVPEMERIARGIRLVKEDEKPTLEEQEKYREYADLRVGTQKIDDWYCLLRNCQGALAPWAHGLDVMIDSHAFLHDSLFCEWAYIINLDTLSLEIYAGFQTTPNGKGRYAGEYSGHEFKEGSRMKRYYGVSLLTEIPLNDIQTLPLMTIWNRLDPILENYAKGAEN